MALTNLALRKKEIVVPRGKKNTKEGVPMFALHRNFNRTGKQLRTIFKSTVAVNKGMIRRGLATLTRQL